MKISKVAATTARRLFGLCQVNGRLDENRLRDLVTKLIASQPRDFRSILEAIKRLTRLELERRQVLVESAVPLNPVEADRVKSGLVRDHGNHLIIQFTTNPTLLGGLRIKIGDDILDGSVKGRIDRLNNAF